MAAVSPLSHASSTPAPQQHPEKRRKITRACDACKAKKKRCTGTQPCPSCEKAAKACTYLASYTRGRFTTPPSSRGLDALLLAAESHNVDFAADRDRRPSSTHTTASDANAPSPQLSRDRKSPQIAAQRHRSLSSAYALPVQSPGHVFTPSQPPSFLPPLPTFQQPQPGGAATEQRRASLQPLLSAVAYQWRPPAVQDPTSKDPSRRPSPEPDGTFDGHYLGPSSSVAWLRRALRKLGQARALKEQLPDASNHASPKDATIFNYGDKDPPPASGPGLALPSEGRTDYLLTRYFEFAAPTYRFLHRPTVESWLAAMHHPTSSLHPAKKAVVLVILAIATLYELSRIKDPEVNIRQESEMYYREAQFLVSKETGPATLESVQARFAQVHYLLSTARSNQAWFAFGTTVQLAMALGLHRRRSLGDKNESLIVRECQRRLFWSMYTTDRYMSVMFGRPRWIQDDDISQEYPLSVNDEDLKANEIVTPAQNDCLEDAAVFHSKLTRIVGKAAKEQYTMPSRSELDRIHAALGHNKALQEWKEQLPAYLSGAIRPSSLIPIFRRQSTVLKLAYAHAVMLVNRPFVLNMSKPDSRASKHNPVARECVEECLGAARTAIEMALNYISEGQPFSSFWFTQYVAFNALAITYLYLLQSRRQGVEILFQYRDLLSIADTCQQYLADVTEANAPSMRYNIILEELREELNRQVSSTTTTTTTTTSSSSSSSSSSNMHGNSNATPNGASMPHGNGTDGNNLHPPMENGTNGLLSPRTLSADGGMLLDGGTVPAQQVDGDGSSVGDFQQLDWDLDFWPQLDSLPMCK
ncbi:fungal-specific transcription factor domain-containing protein [Macrophomina phaseolina]|uniref:Fungal-specific transcription factor domain-containing protein n=1 Tax=Macrophomina phaseolina TaxID=35725 RepID=A0ABQ8G3E2_9PEZI|nr:fungal-specific transcription factor domain-containing protein [Macrophomina phaseolina]